LALANALLKESWIALTLGSISISSVEVGAKVSSAGT